MVSESKTLPADVDAVAPDGSNVRILLTLTAGGLAHFELPPGETSVAVHHRTVEEIWYFVAGEGEMWVGDESGSNVVAVASGVCITIPLGTHFQFRAHGTESLAAVGVTMPPWPGDGEAIRSRISPWPSTVTPGPGLADD